MKTSQFIARPKKFLAADDRRGQAVIEYVLILFVAVSLILTLSSQVIKPFGQWLDFYMGTYVGCLLEYGELPQLNSEVASNLKDDSQCSKKFDANASGTGFGSGRSSGSGEGSSTSSQSSRSNSEASNGQGGSSGTYAGSASRAGNGAFGARRPSSGVESSGARAGKVVEIALDGAGKSDFFRGSGGNSNSQFGQSNRRAIAIAGLTEAEKKQLEKKAEGRGKIISTTEATGLPKKSLIVKPPSAKPTTIEDQPFTVGNFLRYLIIAAIIIALVLLIGGQALQMSKSLEK